MTASAEAPDRRLRRRLETIDEILDHAMAVMAEQGVAGLSLGEVARRMQIRPPSLYGYFASKHAVYDALFARGAASILATMTGTYGDGRLAPSLAEELLTAARAFTAWCLEHPVYSQLLFWRPVPGFSPSAESYAPAVALVQLTSTWLGDLHRAGMIRRSADLDAVIRDWIVLTSGVISQQLANAPDEDVDSGRFTAALPSVVEMFVQHYGAAARPAPVSSRRKGTARAHQR